MSTEDNKPAQYSERFNKTLNAIWEIAVDYKHDYMTLDHVLRGLLSDSDAQDILTAADLDIDELRDNLDKNLKARTDLEGTSPDIEPLEEVASVFASAEDAYPNKGVPIDGAIILAGIMRAHYTSTSKLLRRHGLTMNDVNKPIQEKLAAKGITVAPEKPREPYRMQRGGQNIREFTVNLNERALLGKIDPLIGRDEEVARGCEVLGRRKKNNPMLVGEPGVGKTAIAEGMALRIIHGTVDPSMRQRTIFALDMGALVAGTQYRGMFEERLKNVMEELKSVPGAILFIDEIHTVIGAGNASGGTLDASNILKPALQSGDVTCIGATTYQEYKTFQKKDQALMRRFQKIDIPEPTVEQTIDILRGLKSKYENHHKIEYTDEALIAAAKLSERYINNRKLPDKAIDVIDEVAATKKAAGVHNFGNLVEVSDIEVTVARMAGIPPKQVSSDDKKALKNLDSDLKEAVFDQDAALDALTAKIRLSRAGLRDHTKPIGSYLFSGPTGVGKTEAVKKLSETLGLSLQRFDMSEYMEKHTVSRLIGSPPGYVGHDQGGLLTDAIDQNPYSILLLDEIEKAHPDVHKIFLQAMDNGYLTDTSGKRVSFRNVMIVMTTNAGADKMNQKKIGFNAGNHKNADADAIKKLFPPEFRNRLDAVIAFTPLEPKTMGRIVDKFIGELSERLAERNVEIKLSPESKDYLATAGYDEKMGARPMARLIEKTISEPLSQEILYGALQKGGKVTVEYNQAAADAGEDSRLTFSFNSRSAVAQPEKEPAPRRKQRQPGAPAAGQ